MSDLVLRETDGAISVLTLNRPEKLNALNEALVHALRTALMEADDDPSTSIIVLRGAGRSFCVGYDLGESDGTPKGALFWHKLLNEESAFEALPWTVRKPVIASVRGHALGGGCELMMMCDLAVASANAKFGEPEIRFSVAGPLFIMPWLIGMKRAKELLFFGDLIDAETARSYGMINRVVPDSELDTATMNYARRLSLIGSDALVLTKAALNKGAEAAGLLNALSAGVNAVVPLYCDETEVGKAFKAKVSADGVAAAVKWRNGQFRTSE